ncbi:MAG TPA: DUF6596 domain-containing protein [Polyangiaceae bacterium]|nr:DUF6596 domain-containing protein [Polyangiaceae bacterium]
MELDDAFYRRERARLLAALTRVFGTHNVALAEDVVQETLTHAFEVWSYSGVPDHWSALLVTAAKNRAIDVIRRERTVRKFAPMLEQAFQSEWTLRPKVEELFLPEALRDDELRMMFSTCHPQLAEDVQVALMLNMSCGFGAEEIARAYLASTSAVEKRLSRGKKILAGSPRLFELTAADFEPRLAAVQRALYVLFSEGYHGACDDAPIREELCREALRLARLLIDHVQAATPDAFALAALMYLHAARLPGRRSEVGELLALAEQDRSRWDARLIAEGLALLERASTGTEVSRFHIEATIAGLHAMAPSFEQTPWSKIVELYDLYIQVAPSPVVALNRAMAIAETAGPEAGLCALAEIEHAERLREYPFHAAARGELELRAGRHDLARAHLETAVGLARNATERHFLLRRLATCSN